MKSANGIATTPFALVLIILILIEESIDDDLTVLGIFAFIQERSKT
jgi:hypothetical protein